MTLFKSIKETIRIIRAKVTGTTPVCGYWSHMDPFYHIVIGDQSFTLSNHITYTAITKALITSLCSRLGIRSGCALR